MAKLEMGQGFKTLVYLLAWMLMFGSGVFLGKLYEGNKQTESNIDVLSIDSEVSQEIAVSTAETKVKINETIEELKEPIIDSGGYVSTEFMQLVESSVSDAEQRGNETGIIRAITRP